MKPEKVAILKQFFPEKAIQQVEMLLEGKKICLVFTKHRNTKLGDFRAPRALLDNCTITLNGDLNQYQMLITFLHEYAHYVVYKKYSRRVQPHGAEWKKEFSALVNTFLNEDIFPQSLIQVLLTSINNPKAGALSDVALAKALNNFDNESIQSLTVEEIPIGKEFSLSNGLRFVKLEKLRKRYKCRSLDNGKIYVVSPLARAFVDDK